MATEIKWMTTQMRSWLLKRPSQGSSGSYSWRAYTNNGHWSPGTAISPLESLARTLKQRLSIEYSEQGQDLTLHRPSLHQLDREGHR
jgi:hypothetical protein